MRCLPGGGVACWGDEESQYTGSSATGPPPSPGPVIASTVLSAASVPLGGATAISAGSQHTCALLTDSSVVCWGWNGAGQIGDGSATNRSFPVQVVTAPGVPLTGVSAVAAGGAFTCALLKGGGAACWGANQYGQLGDGTMNPHLTAVTVNASSGVPFTGAAALAAGRTQTCALFLPSGNVECWGSSLFGELGDGTFDPSSTPVTVLGL